MTSKKVKIGLMFTVILNSASVYYLPRAHTRMMEIKTHYKEGGVSEKAVKKSNRNKKKKQRKKKKLERQNSEAEV